MCPLPRANAQTDEKRETLSEAADVMMRAVSVREGM